jgi:5'-methylthioadenosine phosphorylase
MSNHVKYYLNLPAASCKEHVQWKESLYWDHSLFNFTSLLTEKTESATSLFETFLERDTLNMVGIISGTILLHRTGITEGLTERIVENEFGKALVLTSDTIAYIPRHGNDPENYILPHLINHQANMKALKDLGVREVISINSTGSLKENIQPGMLVVPDDFIMLSGGPTIFEKQPTHITPSISETVSTKWIEAARDCGIDIIDEGIYWQTQGPRFETRAEIRLMTQFADLVGMTMASEAIIAKELGLPYASLCSVDNYAHGLIDKELTMDEIVYYARENTEAINTIVNRYIERMGT